MNHSFMNYHQLLLTTLKSSDTNSLIGLAEAFWAFADELPNAKKCAFTFVVRLV